IIHGNPSDERTWQALDEQLQRRYLHASGIELSIRATAIDSGGHHTDEVYQFCRLRRWRNVFAVKGASKPGRPVIAQRPSKVDVNWKGTIEKDGAELWLIGTDTAKDWIYNRYALEGGPGALHFSSDLPEDSYDQGGAERQVSRQGRRYKRKEWVKPAGARAAGLRLLAFDLARAQVSTPPRYTPAEWGRLSMALTQPSQFGEPLSHAAEQGAAADHE